MALIWYEHFDLYGNSFPNIESRGYTTARQGSALATFAGRNGSGFSCNPVQAAAAFIRRIFQQDYNVMGQGCAIRVIAEGGSNRLQNGMHFGTAGDFNYINISINPGLGIRVWLNGALVGEAGLVYVLNSWFWLETKVTAGQGNGSIEVKIQGSTVVLAENLNILPVRVTTIGKTGAPVTTTTQYDDWVVWDDTGLINNNFMGDTFVLVAPPEADGTPSDWTPSSGVDRFSRVNTLAPNDETFISADTVGQTQEFSHTSLNLPVGAVSAIAVQTRAFKNDAGSADYRLGVASGSSTGMSNDIALATGVVSHTHIQNIDPATGLPWTQASAQSARLRIERT